MESLIRQFDQILFLGSHEFALYNSYYFRSKIDVITNRRILFLFCTLIALALTSAVGAYAFDHKQLVHAYYLGHRGLFCFSQNHHHIQ